MFNLFVLLRSAAIGVCLCDTHSDQFEPAEPHLLRGKKEEKRSFYLRKVHRLTHLRRNFVSKADLRD